jgi:3-oxoacyl-[acyl-carrier-protein] synthase III
VDDRGGFCHRPRAVRVLGTGAAVPERTRTSAELDVALGLAPGTVQAATGVAVRHVAEGSAAELGARAARDALAAAGVDLAGIDLIVCASGTPDQVLPCNAALLHAELRPPRPVPAWDLNASCLGFVAALDTVATLVAAGHHERVLVVCADLASTGLDWSDLGASGIFGDGAAAAVLGPAGDSGSGVLAAGFATHSEAAHLCEIRTGSRYAPDRVGVPADPARFRMDGRGVFRAASRHLPGFLDGLLSGAGLALGDVDLVVPHQASHHGLAWLRRLLGVPAERVVDIYAERGNQVSASLPSALHAAVADGRLARGDTVLLVGTGAGLSLGGAVLRW